jgi:hypothetical protein
LRARKKPVCNELQPIANGFSSDPRFSLLSRFSLAAWVIGLLGRAARKILISDGMVAEPENSRQRPAHHLLVEIAPMHSVMIMLA